MAIVKFGPTVSGIRGTLGGTIFSANKSGPFVRGWAQPSNPRSSKQLEERATVSAEAQAWGDLNDTQRDGWDTLAANPIMARTNSLGESYQLSGFTIFLSINVNRVTAGQARRTTAPMPASIAVPTGVSFDVSPAASGGSSITFIDAQLNPNHFLPCWLTVARSAGVTTLYTTFRALVVIDFDDTSPFTITSEITELFGDPTVGYKYFLRYVKQSNNGIRSAISLATTVAV